MFTLSHAQDRGQVPAAINYTSETHALFRPPVDIKRRLLELMLQGCIIDLKQAGESCDSSGVI